MDLAKSRKRKDGTSDGSDDLTRSAKRSGLDTSNEWSAPQQKIPDSQPRRKLTHADYTVGWVCALHIEAAAAVSMLDEEHATLPAIASDTNTYNFGNIGKHNVVICRLPAGHYGTNNAAIVATHLQRSFRFLRIGLMVGIGGGVPGTLEDVRLGDVVVGTSTTQYDFGKDLIDEVFQRTSLSVRPPQHLATAVSALRTSHERTPATLSSMITGLISEGKIGRHYSNPGQDTDQLFDSGYDHLPGMHDCLDCDVSKIVNRPPRPSEQPKIHYGGIASGNRVIKNARARDRIARDSGAICFEMEAAGLIDHFHCLVIRGICDYCDSHKLKNWQRYAAAVAAVYAREFLLITPAVEPNAGDSLPCDYDSVTTPSSNDHKATLDRLPIAEGASFDSRAQEHDSKCLENTRVEVLHQIQDWASNIDPESKSIFWLNGMAGTGKSTISRTIAQLFADKRQLYASFFFKRGEGDRANLSKFFTTMAASLITREPATTRHIKDALEADPLIPTKRVQVQFNELFQQPLSEIAGTREGDAPALIVIDALDECEEDDIKLLFNLFSSIKVTRFKWLKIFITSRPDLPTRIGFKKIEDSHENIVLHEVADAVIKDDITVFLKNRFAEIRDYYNASVYEGRELPLNWPSQSHIQSLAKLAVPLFIFAATICRFVSECRFEHPDERLDGVLNYRTQDGESHFDQLDATYMPILDNLTKGLVGRNRAKMVDKFQRVIGPIVILATPMTTSALSQLLAIPKGQIDVFLDSFHSVLSVPSAATSPVRLLHLSFRDFLVDNEKTSNLFWIDEERMHREMAENCLRMLRMLKQDICEVKAPGTPRSSISSGQINQHLPPEMQYSCLYWVYHVQKARHSVSEGEQLGIYDFLADHFLHWIEALSIIGRASEGLRSIKTLQSLLGVQKNTQLSDFLNDAVRFLQAGFLTIDAFPLQLYSSLLIFAPQRSEVRLVFENRFTRWIYPKPKVDGGWDRCLVRPEGHLGPIKLLTFSPDTSLIAYYDKSQTIWIWNVSSGECVAKLGGHGCVIITIAFATDSNHVAMLSTDGSVRTWHIASEECISKLELEGYCAGAISGTFSSDVSLVASKMEDKTIRIWDTASGECVSKLVSYSSLIAWVTFSADLSFTAFSGEDNNIDIWNTSSGECVTKLKGHSKMVLSAAFTCDKSLIASSSWDETIRIWNATSGECIFQLKQDPFPGFVYFSLDSSLVVWNPISGGNTRILDANSGDCISEFDIHFGPIASFAFSSDSNLVATASHGSAISVSSIKLDRGKPEPEAHDSSVESLAFSPDSSRMVSVSKDQTILISSTESGEDVFKLKGHGDVVCAAVFSPDSALLASASFDTTVRIWDLKSGECISKLEGHISTTKAVAFSPDSTLVALGTSGSNDRALRIWNVNSGQCVFKLEDLNECVKLVTVSPDSTLVAMRTDCAIHVWNIELGELMFKVSVHMMVGATALIFSPDSTLVAPILNDKIIHIRDANSGECVSKLECNSGNVNSAAFSPDWSLVAASSYSQTVCIWSRDTGNCLVTIDMGSVSPQLQFDDAGSTLRTGSGTIVVDAVVSDASEGICSSEPSTFMTGIGLSADKCWITWNGVNVLWLPPQARPLRTDISASRVAMGYESRRVSIIGISSDGRFT